MLLRSAAFVAVCFSLLSGVAEAVHPRAIFDATITARVQAKADAGAADWLTVKGSASGPEFSCDYVTRTTAGTGDSLPPVYAPRQPVTYNPAGTITSGYQGEDFYTIFMNLGVCHRGVLVSNPSLAATYAAQAVKVLVAMSSPFPTVTPASPPSNWHGLTSRPAAYVSNQGPGGQARVNLYYQGLSTGATVTISGVTGCTAANITGKVGAASGLYFDLNDSGGSPVICNAAGTNYGWNILTDAGYGIRFYVTVLALGYDWFYDDLSAGQRTQIIETINAFLDEIKNGYWIGIGPWTQNTQTNYHSGYISALGLSGICTRGGGENARGEEWYTFWRDTMYDAVDKPFFDRWLGNNAGFHEALSYQPLGVNGLALVAFAQYTANAENLLGSAEWPWLLGNMRYWMHNTMPPRTYLSGRGVIPSPSGGGIANPWNNQGMWIIHDLARVNSDALRPKFKRWLDDLTTLNNPTQSLPSLKVLFYDPALSSEDWTTEGLSSAEGSNPAGGYVRVLQRSDWTTSAVYGDLSVGPYIDSTWSGAGRWDKGSLHVQRGNVQLLVAPSAEAVRANSDPTWNYFSNDKYFSYGLYYVTRVGDSNPLYQTCNEANPCPGNDLALIASPIVTTSHPNRIDRYEDQTSYVYSRAVRLDTMSAVSPTGHTAVAGWDRELLYLRPKVFVVYDRTNKLNRVSPAETFTQLMGWEMAKTPVTSAYGSGMYRTEVSDGGTYKGGLTYVLPAGMGAPALDNFGSYGVVYRTKVAPPSETQYVNWLTVVDAADAQANLEEVAKFGTSSNADVIRLGDDTVIGFASYQNGAALALPITYTTSGVTADVVTHRIAGLAASTTYKLTVSGSDVTIAASGGGTDLVSTAAGVASFTSGPGGSDPPVVVSTSTPMPGGTVGVAYSQCFAASGGDDGPYTWTKTVGSFPGGLSLATGCVSGTPTTAEEQTFTMQACDGTPLCGTKQLSITISANAPSITTLTVQNGVVDVPYATQICATGGTPPYTFSKTAGDYCTGLSLTDGSPCATLTGTPTVVQSCSFTIQVEDDSSQTDPQAYSSQVAAGLVEMVITVLSGSNSALVIFGASGMEAGTDCTVEIKQGDVVVGSNDEVLRFARQRSAFNGLVQSTTYGAVVSCPLVSAQASVTFTTLPLEATAPVTVPIVLKPNALLSTVTQVTVDYGVDDVSENTTTVACTTGCTVNLSLSAGIYVYRYIWKDAGGNALATSNTRELIVP